MVKKDVKYLTLSLIGHAIFLALILLGAAGKQGNSDKAGKAGKGGNPGDNKTILEKDKRVEVVMVDMVKGPKKAAPKKKKVKKKQADSGYYGIGVNVVYGILDSSTMINYNGAVYVGMTITNVPYGNPAWEAGLLPGDVLFMVDGGPLTDANELVGKGPADLVVGVSREGRIFFVNVRRDWIQVEKQGN